MCIRDSFDLSRISNWGKENMVVFNASKTHFLHTQHNLSLSLIFLVSLIGAKKTWLFSMPQKPTSFILSIISLSLSLSCRYKGHNSSSQHSSCTPPPCLLY